MLVLSVETASYAEAAVLSGSLAAGYTTALSGSQITITFGRGDQDRMIVALSRTIEDCLAEHRIEQVTLTLRGSAYVLRATP